jgi:hypothetical protein
MTKYNKKMIEKLILEQIGSYNVQNIVDAENQKNISDAEAKQKEQEKLQTQAKKALNPEQTAVQTENYKLLKKKATELNSQINTLPVQQMISKVKELLSQISAI